MPHLLEVHFRRFIKYYEKKQEIKKQKLEKKEQKKENITKSDNDDITKSDNFEDFFMKI